MNRIYRLVFNCELGLVQIASELTSSAREGAGSADGVRTATLPALRFAICVALGLVMTLPAFAQASQGRIVGDPNAPGQQRPQVLEAPNGAALVNITTPSAAGVSRNQYSQFDVGAENAIFNNARTNVQTQTGGWVQGNPWLATGTARVILNEVNSASPSHLNGYVEVAGDRAEVIVANPSGIQVDGGGFINASRATLTTGRPLISNGALDGYRVEGSGAIQVSGAGLDASRTAYTDLIARSVQLNAGVWADWLRVTTGANTVSADHTQISKLESASGTTPQFALDVSALGGMYANHIALVGTEAGVGVSNAGTIGAQAGDLTVTVDGRLVNTGSLQSQQDTQVDARGGVANAGTLSAARELTVTTPRAVDNSRGTLNARRIEVNAQSLGNRGGLIEQAGAQALAMNAGTLSNRDDGRIGAAALTGGGEAGGTSVGGTGGDGGNSGGVTGGTEAGSQPGVISLADGALNIAGALNNDAGRIKASGIDLVTANGLDNDGGHLDLRELRVSSGDLGNARGELTVSGAATLHIGVLNNDAGRLNLAGPLTFDAQRVSNRLGTLQHAATDATTLNVASTLDNTDGTLASNASALALNAAVFVNERGELRHAGAEELQIQTGVLSGAGGSIATAGELALRATAVDNRGATLSATQVEIAADSVDNRGGRIVATGDEANTLRVRDTLDNGDRGTISSNGDMAIDAATFGNAAGTVQHAGTGALTIEADTLDGPAGTLASNGALSITGQATNLRGGSTTARRVTIDTGTLTTAGGALTVFGTDTLALRARDGLDNAAGKIQANGALAVQAGTLGNAGGTLTAAGNDASTIAIDATLDNSGGTLATAGATAVQAGELSNRGGTLQVAGEAPLTVAVAGRLDNSAQGMILAGGDIRLSAATLDNTRGAIQHAGPGALDIMATALDGAEGTIASNGGLTLRGESTNLRGGTTVARKIAIDTGALTTAGGQLTALGADALALQVRDVLDNTAGAIATNGALQLQAGALANGDGTIKAVGAGASYVHVANALDNTRGILASAGNATVQAGALTNVGGTVQAAGSSTLQVTVDGRLDNSAQGMIAAGGAARVTSESLDNRAGTMSSGDTLEVAVAQALDNDGGLIASTHALAVTADSLANRAAGTLASVEGALEVSTAGRIDNAGGKIQAAGDAAVTSSGLGNAGGAIVGAGTRVDAREQALDNGGGTIASTTGKVDIQTGALNNDAGLVQSATTMTVDTHGQALSNRNAGASGGLIGGGAMSLAAGDLDSRAGVVHAQGDLVARMGVVDNTSGSRFGGATNVRLDATSLRNSGSTLQAGQNLTAALSGDADNTAGLIVAGGTLDLSADTIANRNTASANSSAVLGLQGGVVTLNASRVDNTAGLVAADTHIGIAGIGVGSTLDNSGGSVSSAGGISVAVDTVTITGGTLLSGTNQTISANKMTGDGRVLSQGDLTIALQQDFDHSGEITANGKADIGTAGTLTNRSKIQAGDLTVRGANVDNTVTGEITGGRTHVIASNTVQNRGLIDGGETRIDAATLDNVGTGRIYGNHIALRAGTVNNREETIGAETKAATIAARERLDIGAGTLNNREQALIFSGGSGADALNIGGALDADGHAGGRAGFVHNASATIESLGGLTIATTRLLNSNEHFATQEVQVGGPTEVFYIQRGGDPNQYDASNFVWQSWSRAGRYRWKDDPPPNETGVLGASPVPRVGEQACTGESDDTCTRVPGADYLPGDPAWGYFGVAEPTAAPAEPVLADYADQAAFDAAHAQWQTAQATWEAETEARYTALDERIETYNDTFAGAEIRNWTQYEVTRTEYETQVTSSAPAQIRSGGSMWLYGDDLVNDKSQIMVGGLLGGDLGNLRNDGAFGTHRVHETGTSQYTYSRWRGGFKRYHQREWDDKIAYTPADVRTQIELSIAPVGGSGYQVAGRQGGVVGGDIAGGASASGGAAARQITEVAAQVAAAQGPAGANGNAVAAGDGPEGADAQRVGGASAAGPTVVRTIGIEASVPNSSLFRTGASASGYLVETDPQFAHYRSWLGSDYLLGLLGTDPTYLHKRLGDGYYEQRLVREQIGQLTGRRFLDGYASDEAQYRALMENGATFAQAWNLRPGVALSAEQMAQLTSDIVWLVEQQVTLPDGTTTTALLPQVYVRVRPGDLNGNGTLISAEVIDLDMKGDLVNSGTIAGRTAVQLTGENLHNLGGRITGDAVVLRAGNDINNIGGTIDAGSTLVATAGRDINVVTTTQSDAKQAGLSDFSRTNVDRVAGLYVSNPDGTMLVASGRDVNLVGARVVIAGEGGQTVIAAGRDLNLATVQTGKQENNVGDADNYLKQGYTREVGTIVSSAGGVMLQAEGDINARVATVTSDKGAVVAMAKSDVNITSGEETANFSEGRKRTHSSGLGSTTKTTRNSVEETWSQGSTLSGKTVAIQGQNIHVTGSTVISDEGTALVAQDKIAIDAAQNTRTENHFQQTERSGLFAGGEVGFTIGKQQLANEADVNEVTHTGSVIGSIDGRVDMWAGGHVGIAGSDVIGSSGVSISGKSVTIEHIEDTLDVRETQTAKSIGLHISIKGGVADAVSGAAASLKRSGEVKDDRLQALYIVQAGQALYGGGNSPVSAGAIGNQTSNAKDVVNGDQKANNGGMSLRIGVGASSSKAESESHQASAHSATVYSGNGDVSVVAREGDLAVIGSTVQGINTTVAAAGDLILLSAKEESELKEKSKAQSGEIGVTIGSEAGIGVYVSASMAKGKGAGSGTTHAEAIIGSDRGTTAFVSGGDTIGQGAQIIGDKVIGRVGGDLRLTSEQDTNDYQRKDTAAGIDAAIGTGGGQISGYVSQSKVNSTYTSVKEQTGILVGQGGYDIEVAGHTQLDGAAIGSAADPSKNFFSTGSLGWSDLKNEAEYKATSVSVSGSGGSSGGSVSASFNQDSGSASSTTKAGIADGTLVVKDGSGQGIGRGVVALQQDGLQQIYDAQKVAETIELQQVAGSVAFTAAKDLISSRRDAAGKELSEAARDYESATTEDERAAALQRRDAAQDSMQRWSDGGSAKVGAQVLAGVFQASLGGTDLLGAASGVAANEYLLTAISNRADGSGLDADSAGHAAGMSLAAIAVGWAAGAAAGGGAAGAISGNAAQQFGYYDYRDGRAQTLASQEQLLQELANGDPATFAAMKYLLNEAMKSGADPADLAMALSAPGVAANLMGMAVIESTAQGLYGQNYGALSEADQRAVLGLVGGAYVTVGPTERVGVDGGVTEQAPQAQVGVKSREDSFQTKAGRAVSGMIEEGGRGVEKAVNWIGQDSATALAYVAMAAFGGPVKTLGSVLWENSPAGEAVQGFKQARLVNPLSGAIGSVGFGAETEAQLLGVKPASDAMANMGVDAILSALGAQTAGKGAKSIVEGSDGFGKKVDAAGDMPASTSVSAKGVPSIVEPKIAQQMGKRGWTTDSLEDAIANPSKTVATKDTRFDPISGTRLNDPATGYVAKDGSYVVRNDRTGAIVQVSDKNDKNWVAPWD